MEVRELFERMRQREDQLFLLLTLIIGALVGLTIVAFIIATERVGVRLYPADGAAWRRLVTPIIGALVTGYFLFRYFPEARGSGIPQTKTALFAGSGDISLLPATHGRCRSICMPSSEWEQHSPALFAFLSLQSS